MARFGARIVLPCSWSRADVPGNLPGFPSSGRGSPLEPSPSAEMQAMLAVMIVASARLMPMLRMVSFMRSFCWAKTCSTVARTTDFMALALAMRFGIGLPTGFLQWIRLVLPRWLRNSSFALER